MTKLLHKYLSLAIGDPGPARRAEIVNTIPRELGAWYDGKIEPVRELLLSTSIESTNLVQTEIAATVVEGAEPYKIMRQALNVLPMSTGTLDIPVGEVGSYAREVAEGAEVPISTQDYSKVTFTAKKIAERPVITEEAIADANYPVIELELRKAGAKLENKINQMAVVELVDSSSANEHDTAGSSGNQGIKAIAAAIAKVEADGFMPDRIVMCPGFKAGLMAEFVPTGYSGADTVMTGKLPNLLGLQAFVSNVVHTTAASWAYAQNDNLGAVVYDSQNSTMIGIRQDITVKSYENIPRMLRDTVVSARVAVGTIQKNAGARIKF
jgi:hypothetical protein